jgi:hypothetical protein
MTSLGRIYLDEMRQRLNPWGVALFEPDSAGVEVGTFGTFVDGRFQRSAHLRHRGVTVPVESKSVGAFQFVSEGRVTLGPSVTVPTPTGGSLVKASLDFARGRAVVACFSGVQEHYIDDEQLFLDEVKKAYFDGRLAPDQFVVYKARSAANGTVVVASEGGFSLEVSAELPTSELGWPDVAAGVKLGGGHAAGYAVSDTSMVAFVMLKRLSDDDVPRVIDVNRFQSDPAELERATRSARLHEVAEDEL